MINTIGIKKIGIMLLGIVLGAWLGELTQYVIWTVGDFAVPYCAANAPPEWHETCLKNLGNYNEFKIYFQLVGVIVGVAASITAVKKIFD